MRPAQTQTQQGKTRARAGGFIAIIATNLSGLLLSSPQTCQDYCLHCHKFVIPTGARRAQWRDLRCASPKPKRSREKPGRGPVVLLLSSPQTCQVYRLHCHKLVIPTGARRAQWRDLRCAPPKPKRCGENPGEGRWFYCFHRHKLVRFIACIATNLSSRPEPVGRSGGTCVAPRPSPNAAGKNPGEGRWFYCFHRHKLVRFIACIATDLSSRPEPVGRSGGTCVAPLPSPNAAGKNPGEGRWFYCFHRHKLVRVIACIATNLSSRPEPVGRSGGTCVAPRPKPKRCGEKPGRGPVVFLLSSPQTCQVYCLHRHKLVIPRCPPNPNAPAPKP